ncbi:MAG: hypothetical protein ABI867_28305 [Kofleriaceae bacterium]
MKRSIISLPFALLVLSQMGSTECGGILEDPGFDLWCGDTLCSWKVVRGDVKRVPTWHSGDSGVELVGSDAAIEQRAPVNSFDGSCILFSFVANVDDTTDTFLDIDVFGDGTVDRRERIPAADWKPLQFHILIDGPYDGIRFELSKTGTGTAVLAQIAAEISTECVGIEPIVLPPRPNGASCSSSSQCESDRCAASPTATGFTASCIGCDPANPSECGAGKTCGIGNPLEPSLEVPVDCVAVAARELGEMCIADAECASGKCNATGSRFGACSACEAASECGTGNACAPSYAGGPSVCAQGAAGAGCGANADCASNHCSGSVRKTCNDGRSCVTDANCPVDAGLTPGPCTTVGIQGGTCD